MSPLRHSNLPVEMTGLLLSHSGCLKQLCAIAGGRGQCDEPLQLQALGLLQLAVAKPPKPPSQTHQSAAGKNDKAPLVGAILGSVEELLVQSEQAAKAVLP